MGRRGRRRKQLSDDLKENERILEIERENTISHSVENSLWKRLWTCGKTDYGMNDGRTSQYLVTLSFSAGTMYCSTPRFY
jgi:hypothetical protein